MTRSFNSRVGHAHDVIMVGGPYNRAFDDCFEEFDGDVVVAALMEWAARDKAFGLALSAYLGSRRQWTETAAPLGGLDLDQVARDRRREGRARNVEIVRLRDGEAVQALIPGVAAVSLACRDLDAERRRREGRRRFEPMAAGGLFDQVARAQGDFFA